MLSMSLEKKTGDSPENQDFTVVGPGFGARDTKLSAVQSSMNRSSGNEQHSSLSKTERRRLAKKRKKEKHLQERSVMDRKKGLGRDGIKNYEVTKGKSSVGASRMTHDERKAKYTALAREKRDRKTMMKRFSDTICFYCREKGHTAVDCPEKKRDVFTHMDEIESDKICYKCGSTEHALRDCHKFKKALAQLARQKNKGNARIIGGTAAEKEQQQNKGEDGKTEKNEPTLKAYVDLPYAKCFVCGEMGHLSSVCNKNSKGLYVHGGSCRYCESKFHLAKDCPHHDGDNAGKDDGVEVENMEQDLGMATHDGAGDDLSSPRSRNTSSKAKRKVVKF